MIFLNINPLVLNYCKYLTRSVLLRIQLFRERLSNKSVRDNTVRYYG